MTGMAYQLAELGNGLPRPAELLPSHPVNCPLAAALPAAPGVRLHPPLQHDAVHTIF